MASTLNEWDRDTAPHLKRIEWCAENLVYWTGQIELASQVLKGMPEFKTRAEAMLDEAIKQIEQAKKELNNKRPGE